MKSSSSKNSLRKRNFLARHPLMKKGGIHRKSTKAQRKAAKLALAKSGAHGYEYPGKEIDSRVNLFARAFVGGFSLQGGPIS